MNRRLRLTPPKQTLDAASGRWISPILAHYPIPTQPESMRWPCPVPQLRLQCPEGSVKVIRRRWLGAAQPRSSTQVSDNSERVMYPIYRPTAKFEEPYEAEDRTFSDARLDDKAIGGANYRHCTFVDASFKGTTLRNCQFMHCIFLGCYFRHTTLKNCTFTGCRFYDCQFPYVNLHTCDFQYSLFKSCQVPFSEMEDSLPRAPNLREQLCRNLAIRMAGRSGSMGPSRAGTQIV